jgi:hypothetical protein
VRKRKKEWDEERDIPERRNEAKNKLKRERMTGERRLFGTAAELKRCKKDAPTGTKKKLERVIKGKGKERYRRSNLRRDEKMDWAVVNEVDWEAIPRAPVKIASKEREEKIK